MFVFLVSCLLCVFKADSLGLSLILYIIYRDFFKSLIHLFERSF